MLFQTWISFKHKRRCFEGCWDIIRFWRSAYNVSNTLQKILYKKGLWTISLSRNRLMMCELNRAKPPRYDTFRGTHVKIMGGSEEHLQTAKTPQNNQSHTCQSWASLRFGEYCYAITFWISVMWAGLMTEKLEEEWRENKDVSVRRTHLESSFLDGDLAVDPSAVIRTDGLQLVFVQREELSAGQHTQTVDSPADQTITAQPISLKELIGRDMHFYDVWTDVCAQPSYNDTGFFIPLNHFHFLISMPVRVTSHRPLPQLLIDKWFTLAPP